MRTAVILLAIAGIAAILLRIVTAGFGVLRVGVDGYLAREMGNVRAQRGDITGLRESAESRALLRRRRFRATGVLLMWVGLLLVPPLTPWPQLLYAAYSLLWLLPRRTAIQRVP